MIIVGLGVRQRCPPSATCTGGGHVRVGFMACGPAGRPDSGHVAARHDITRRDASCATLGGEP